MQKGAIRKDLGSFREEKREGETAQKLLPSKHCNPGRSGKFPGRETGRRNGPETVSFKTPQSGKIQEVSGKRNGKRETDYQKTRSPGRSGKIPGRFPGRDVSTVSPVFNPFPAVSPAPDFPNPDHVSISWSKVCTREVTNAVSGPGGPGTHFLALEAQVGETGFWSRFYGPFLAVSYTHLTLPTIYSV